MDIVCESPIANRRCEQLERILMDLIEEAHVRSLAGFDVCEHDADVCFCGYHEALDRGLAMLNLRSSRRDHESLGSEIQRRRIACTAS